MPEGSDVSASATCLCELVVQTAYANKRMPKESDASALVQAWRPPPPPSSVRCVVLLEGASVGF